MDFFQHGEAVAAIKQGARLMQSPDYEENLAGEKLLEAGRAQLAAGGMSEVDINDVEANSTMADQPNAARHAQFLNTPAEERSLIDIAREVFGEEAADELLARSSKILKEGR